MRRGNCRALGYGDLVDAEGACDGLQCAWLPCLPRFLLPVPVFSKLFRGLMLSKLLAAHTAGKLQFFNQYAHLAERRAFARYLAPLRRRNWYVYSKTRS
jgi:hypothetical protein